MSDLQPIYQPPSEKVIRQFAADVCERLAENGNPSFNQPDVVRGFADFIMLVARITAKQLNKNSFGFDID